MIIITRDYVGAREDMIFQKATRQRHGWFSVASDTDTVYDIEDCKAAAAHVKSGRKRRKNTIREVAA